jgi:hypothetical protein
MKDFELVRRGAELYARLIPILELVKEAGGEETNWPDEASQDSFDGALHFEVTDMSQQKISETIMNKKTIRCIFL